jgi:sulfide:quinone oxidoreductase
VAEPFAPGSVRRYPLAAIGDDRGVRVHRDVLARVHPDDRSVETESGARLGYDALVLALGTRAVEARPGALTFRGPGDADQIRAMVAALREVTIRRVAFVVPAGTTWSLPLYELALETADAVEGTAAELTVVTAETSPLAAFGSAAGRAVAALLEERGVGLRTGVIVDDLAEGRVWLDLNGSFPTDRTIALPLLAGPRPRGIPCNPLGFVEVDEYTRVLGVDDVFAVGDAAAHGAKQGGLAAQQADVAAAVIAADAGVEITPQPFRPVLHGVLLTGRGTRYLRHEPGGPSEVSDELLWWHPGKIAGRHLAPYLAERVELSRPLLRERREP